MSLAVTFVGCVISFLSGYRLKAYFEENQKRKLEILKAEHEEKLKKADYRTFLVSQDYQRLQKEFNHFKEQVKKEALSKIIKEEEKNLKPSLNFLSKL